jgi:asparagine synthase (glutamine-hydrolysing)
MCGIVGVVNSKNSETDWLQAASNALSHRGPDSHGLWQSPDKLASFAHRRLAIIDLSAAGHQPMIDQDSGIAITFNGEIYNYQTLRKVLQDKGHQFQTRTDTEVILKSFLEWGQDCPQHLDGMFAFAIYDPRDRKLFVARDRAGEKPLFYAREANSLYFGSELKALFCNPRLNRKINPKSLETYLSFGFVPGSDCIIEGVSKLAPASRLLFDIPTATLKVDKYWEPPAYNSSIAVDPVLLLEELESLLHKSVQQQLVSDVSVGVLLSGGLDSSLVTAFAARSKQRIKTFSVVFNDDPAFNEAVHSRLIADYFKTDHTEIQAQPASVDLVPMLARQFDEPMMDSSMIPTYLVSKAIRQSCTVALGGDGGDELFGGYQHYQRMARLEGVFRMIPKLLRKIPSTLAQTIFPDVLKGRNWLKALSFDYDSTVPIIARYFYKNEIESLLTKTKLSCDFAESHMTSRAVSRLAFLERVLRYDFDNYLPEDILVKVDRSSMLCSLEVRAPFLGREIIDYSFRSVPISLKVNKNERKIILKHLARKVLPPSFNVDRKQGFSIPLSKWMQTKEWQDLINDSLLSSNNTFFNKSTVSKVLSNKKFAERSFGLLTFDLWRREYKAYL